MLLVSFTQLEASNWRAPLNDTAVLFLISNVYPTTNISSVFIFFFSKIGFLCLFLKGKKKNLKRLRHCSSSYPRQQLICLCLIHSTDLQKRKPKLLDHSAVPLVPFSFYNVHCYPPTGKKRSTCLARTEELI